MTSWNSFNFVRWFRYYDINIALKDIVIIIICRPIFVRKRRWRIWNHNLVHFLLQIHILWLVLISNYVFGLPTKKLLTSVATVFRSYLMQIAEYEISLINDIEVMIDLQWSSAESLVDLVKVNQSRSLSSIINFQKRIVQIFCTEFLWKNVQIFNVDHQDGMYWKMVICKCEDLLISPKSRGLQCSR